MVRDVIVAGAGPVGLFLACELKLAGVDVLLLERLEDPKTPLKVYMGMRALNLPSTEAFYRRGMLEDVRGSAMGWMGGDARGQGPGPRGEGQGDARGQEKQASAAGQRPGRRGFGGHFAGIVLDPSKLDFSGEKWMLPGPSAAGGIVTMAGIEEVLRERAAALGVEFRLGAEVTSHTQDADGVTVAAGGDTLRAKWLVGCDGGRSNVRKQAGFDFVGTDPELSATLALAEFDDIHKLEQGWNATPLGMYINGPQPGRVTVVDFDGGAAAAKPEITREEFEETLQRVSGTDIRVTKLHLATRYTDRARQATTYRKGRVLLAGDAAHVHSPFGGQGMNLGLGDAMNLGWKLAAAVKGWSGEGLLESYTAERHPVGAWALEWTPAQIAILRPEPQARAMRQVMAELLETREGASFIARKIAGIWQTYDLGGTHELVGRSAPDFAFEEGGRLGELMHDGRGLLLELDGGERLHTIAAGWDGRVKCVAARPKESFGLRAVLVRPDGFVAWVDAGEGDAGLREALERWLGQV